MMAASPPWTAVAQLVVVAIQLVVLSIAAEVARRQVNEARRLREAQARPFVGLDFDVRDKSIFIVISNTGKTLARDVRFEIEPALDSTIDGYQAKDLKIFREGVSTLAPGKVIRTLFDWFPDRESRPDLPDAFKVSVRYSDGERRRLFEEVIDLDIDIYRNLMSIRRDEIHHVNQTLDKMLKEIKKWRAGSRGLLVMSPRVKRAEGERRAREVERARRELPFAQHSEPDGPGSD